MRAIHFEDNLTTDCPISDIGDATTDECTNCLYFRGFEGFDAHCAYEEPEPKEAELAKMTT